jgi:hypothetical protein
MTPDRYAPHLNVAQLSAITGNVGELTSGQIHDASDSYGILLSGSVPASWSRWLNLVDSGSAFLKHDNLELAWDGSATFSGEVASDTFTATFADFGTALRVVPSKPSAQLNSTCLSCLHSSGASGTPIRYTMPVLGA